MNRFFLLLLLSLVLTLSLSFTNCSTHYVGHRDDPQPFKTDYLQSQVKLTKQDTLSLDRSTITYHLSKNSPVANHYKGVDIYKKSSPLGLGMMLGSVTVGYLGVTNWAKGMPPDTNSWDSQADIDRKLKEREEVKKDKKLGQQMTLWSIGGFLTGVAVHYITNGKVTKGTFKVDTVSTSNPIPFSPINIYLEDKLTSSLKSDEKGNTEVDLLQFLQDQYRGKDLRLKVVASDYQSVSEYFSIPASFLAQLKQTQEEINRWKIVGFDPVTMKDWKAVGFISEEEAKDWKLAGFEPFAAASWRSEGLTPEQARIKEQAKRKAEAVAQAKEEKARAKAEANQREYERLKAQAKNMYTLIMTNPYDVKDNIYEVTGIRFSLLSQSVALYKADTFIFLADCGSTSAPYILQGIARGVGPYSYLTTLGTQNTVPRLKVLFSRKIE